MPSLEGGCLCGDIRYKVGGELTDKEVPTLCHCRICQQSTGAPVVPWATFNEVCPLPCLYVHVVQDITEVAMLAVLHPHVTSMSSKRCPII